MTSTPSERSPPVLDDEDPDDVVADEQNVAAYEHALAHPEERVSSTVSRTGAVVFED